MKNLDANNKQLFETILRLGCAFLVLAFCFKLLIPFLIPTLWGIILAIILYPLFDFLQQQLKGRKTLASVLITVVIVGLLIIPVIYILNAATSNILELKSSFEAGTLKIAPPAETMKSWPIIGQPLYDFLYSLSTDMQEAIHTYKPQLTDLSKRLMGSVISSGVAFLQFILSVIIAGILLVSEGAKRGAMQFLRKIAGENGDEIASITVSTVHQVVKGILGVAVIQTIIQALGLFLADIPFAGILTILCLILSIFQIGPILINIGVIIYLFSTGNDYAIVWTIFFILSGLSDNVLKPILLGKGAVVPMLVIFLGVIGGFIMSGFIGLFIGPIIFSIGYKLFVAWLREDIGTNTVTDVDSNTL